MILQIFPFPSVDCARMLYNQDSGWTGMDDDCAVVIETERVVRVDVLLPNVGVDTIRVDKVPDGIIVQAKDDVEIQCFVALPNTADVTHMTANLEGRQLSLLIPKLPFSSTSDLDR